MTSTGFDVFEEFGLDSRPDAELTRDEVVARNLKVVNLHFHCEDQDDVEKAVALYTDDISDQANTVDDSGAGHR